MDNLVVPNTIDEDITPEPCIERVRELSYEIYRELLIRHMELLGKLVELVSLEDKNDSLIDCDIALTSMSYCVDLLDSMNPIVDVIEYNSDIAQSVGYLSRVLFHVGQVHGYREVLVELVKTPQFVSCDDQIRTKLLDLASEQLGLISLSNQRELN